MKEINKGMRIKSVFFPEGHCYKEWCKILVTAIFSLNVLW